MDEYPSPEDMERIRKLGLLTQELALLQDRVDKWNAMKKAMVVDLVQREVISQSRAARIAELNRGTVAAWVNTWPGDLPSPEDYAEMLLKHERETDAAELRQKDAHKAWRPGLDPWTEV